MSHTITFIPTIFTNPHTGEVTKGYRATDDYEAVYNNHWDDIPENKLLFLKKVVDTNKDFGTVDDLLERMEGSELGCTISGKYYEWDQIKEIIGER